MKTVILIHGVARSGKDTFAEMLVPKLCRNDLTATVCPNAYGVKEIARGIYGWNLEKDEKGRQLLLDVTSTGYNYDPMFWEKYAHKHVKHLEKSLMNGNPFDFVIVPDYRYPITQRYYRSLGVNVLTIKVTRPNHDNELGSLKNHESETALSNEVFDYYVDNIADLEFLEKQAEIVAYNIRGKLHV